MGFRTQNLRNGCWKNDSSILILISGWKESWEGAYGAQSMKALLQVKSNNSKCLWFFSVSPKLWVEWIKSIMKLSFSIHSVTPFGLLDGLDTLKTTHTKWHPYWKPCYLACLYDLSPNAKKTSGPENTWHTNTKTTSDGSYCMKLIRFRTCCSFIIL